MKKSALLAIGLIAALFAPPSSAQTVIVGTMEDLSKPATAVPPPMTMDQLNASVNVKDGIPVGVANLHGTQSAPVVITAGSGVRAGDVPPQPITIAPAPPADTAPAQPATTP